MGEPLSDALPAPVLVAEVLPAEVLPAEVLPAGDVELLVVLLDELLHAETRAATTRTTAPTLIERFCKVPPLTLADEQLLWILTTILSIDKSLSPGCDCVSGAWAASLILAGSEVVYGSFVELTLAN
jgi:hypothetical protein